jgi:flavodoxin I
MKKIGLFYGPVSGSTERIAEKIWNLIGKEKCDLLKVRDSKKEDLARYDSIIFGISTIGAETWDAEAVKSGWFTFIHELTDADLTGKKFAIFGLGDQIRYPDHFVDAMGDLYEILSDKGSDTVGKVDPAGYQFTDSKALLNGKFVGLPLDEDFQSDLTDSRIRAWLGVVLPALV